MHVDEGGPQVAAFQRDPGMDIGCRTGREDTRDTAAVQQQVQRKRAFRILTGSAGRPFHQLCRNPRP